MSVFLRQPNLMDNRRRDRDFGQGDEGAAREAMFGPSEQGSRSCGSWFDPCFPREVKATADGPDRLAPP
jgi:hypothetical protein